MCLALKNAINRLPDLTTEQFAFPTWLRKQWAWLIAWMILIFALSHMDGNTSASKSQLLVDLLLRLGINPEVLPVEVLSLIVRKTAHFSEYLVLAIISLPLFRHYRKGNSPPYWLLAWGFCVLYAASDEWHQTFIPGREGRATDVMIDAVGAALGGWLANRRLRKRI